MNVQNPPAIRDRSECVRSDKDSGRDTSNCTNDHACRHPGTGIGSHAAHFERRAAIAGIKH